jgi:hypothetical protein
MSGRSTPQVRLTVAIMILVMIVLILAYFLFDVDQQDGLLSGLFTELVAALLIAAIAFFAGRFGMSLSSLQAERTGPVVSFFPQHAEMDWRTIIGSARKIDIVVHYSGRWLRRLHDDFVRFFERGGKLRIVMADPGLPEVLSTVQTHFFPNLGLEQLEEKIVDTERRLISAFNDAGSRKASFSTHYFPQALHYSFVLVNDRFLYLSVYEQFRGPNVRSSVFGIDLSRDLELEAYWHQTRDIFLERSRQARAAPADQ